jgi:hypothetical protein
MAKIYVNSLLSYLALISFTFPHISTFKYNISSLIISRLCTYIDRSFSHFHSVSWLKNSSGPRPPQPWGFQITLRNTTLGTTLDGWSARCRGFYLKTNNTNKRQTSMPGVGFEPAFPAIEWSPELATCMLHCIQIHLKHFSLTSLQPIIFFQLYFLIYA